MSTFPHRLNTALHDRLTTIGQGWTKPLTTHVHAVQQRFTAGVTEVGRRTTAEVLDARRSELDRLLDNMERRGKVNGSRPAPLVVHLVVRPE